MYSPPSFVETVLEPLLKQMEWDRKELAIHIGMDPSTPTKWVRDGIIPDDKALERINQLTTIDIDFWRFAREYTTFLRRLSRAGIDPDDYLGKAA